MSGVNEQEPSVPHEDAPSSRRTPGALELVAGLVLLGGIGLVAYSLLSDSSGNDSPAAPADSSTAGLNVSCFAYRDVDRDGMFDVDDRPFAWLPVGASGPNGTATAVSNTAGFANFEMLLGGDAAFIDRAGTYEFTPEVPAGWMLTSDPATQAVEFVELPGSPVGVAAAGQCVPYGLAPVDDPVVAAVPVDDGDLPDPLATSVVVGFDDLITANTLTEIPSGYRGLGWSNWVATHRIFYGGPGYVNGATSGEYVAYNSSGNPATVSSDDAFDFVGANISSAWPGGEAHDVVVQAWRGDELVHVDRFAVSATGPVYFDADYRSITRLELSSEANWQFVVDDAEFRLGSTGG
jgi:hypothetical protein